ncbi:MAG: response regulator [Planctomycetia bacterium]
MTPPVSFHQSCPVCGRTLRIGVNLLGSRVYCQHCGGGFRASDASLSDHGAAAERPSRSIVDELLERAELVLQRQGNERDDASNSSPAIAASRSQ